MLKKIAENVCGFAIGGCAICLWRYWGVAPELAALLVAFGLLLIYDSFGGLTL